MGLEQLYKANYGYQRTNYQLLLVFHSTLVVILNVLFVILNLLVIILNLQISLLVRKSKLMKNYVNLVACPKLIKTWANEIIKYLVIDISY